MQGIVSRVDISLQSIQEPRMDKYDHFYAAMEEPHSGGVWGVRSFIAFIFFIPGAIRLAGTITMHPL
jgi:hypothetical protein